MSDPGLRRREGLPLAGAVVEAFAVIVGASVILNGPIFQGLAAFSLMAGEVASLLISRFAVPLIYFMAFAGSGKTPPAA